MSNTFLDTGRVVAASSNPEANIEQVNNNQNVPVDTQQTTQTAQSQSTNNNTINPITIPIQIQPQVAQTSTPKSVNNNVQQLQANPTQANSAPTPQEYNPSNTNNNVVDFNQIYKSYQSSFGNNQNTNSNVSQSGIKKTSVGTTIVTPTTSNINSINGQYQSAYADTINSLISEMLTQMKSGFQYDPATDSALKVATEYAANSTLQSLAGSGVLNSSATAERVARIVSDLIPTYEEKAHDRWIEYLGQLADTAQIVMNYDSQQFEYWKDAKDREFQEKQFEYQKQQDELENAWKRVDELGYVDNKASQILGVKVGTLSGEARLAKEQQEYELAKMREQAEIEYQNNVALYKLKSELDTQQSKALAEYDYTLAQKYGTSSNKSSSNYSTYDEIIKNRYAEYDDFTKQYVVPDEQTYNQLMNYLDNLNASGAITDTEFLQLVAKYSKYSGQTSSTSTNVTTNASTSTSNNSKNNTSLWNGTLSAISSLFSKKGG